MYFETPMSRWQDESVLGGGGPGSQMPVSNHSFGSSIGEKRLEGCAESSHVQGKVSGQCQGAVGGSIPGLPTLFLGRGLWPAERGLLEGPFSHQLLRSPAAAPAYHPALWTGKPPPT